MKTSGINKFDYNPCFSARFASGAAKSMKHHLRGVATQSSIALGTGMALAAGKIMKTKGLSGGDLPIYINGELSGNKTQSDLAIITDSKLQNMEKASVTQSELALLSYEKSELNRKIPTIALFMTDSYGSRNSNNSVSLDEYSIKDISDDEYADIWSRINEKKSEFLSFRAVCGPKLNIWNIQLLDYMLQHPEEFKDKHRGLVDGIASESGSVPESKNEAELILRGLKSSWIMNNKQFEDSLVHIAWLSECFKRNGKFVIKLFDKLDERQPELNFRQSNNLINIINDVKGEYGYRVAKKFIENPELIPSKYFYNDNFFQKHNKKVISDYTLEIMDKIISNPEVFEQEHSDYGIAIVLEESAENDRQRDFIFKILDNPKFFNNEVFISKLRYAIYAFDDKSSINEQTYSSLVEILIDMVSAKPELFESPKFIKYADHLIRLDENSITDNYNYKERLNYNYDLQKFLIEKGFYD